MSVAAILIGYVALIAQCGWTGVGMVVTHLAIMGLAGPRKKAP